MKKIKLFIIQLLLFACLIISNSFSKDLPPGSGDGDVHANILILLDKVLDIELIIFPLLLKSIVSTYFFN